MVKSSVLNMMEGMGARFGLIEAESFQAEGKAGGCRLRRKMSTELSLRT